MACAQDVEKIRRDHQHMLELISRIQAECTQREKVNNCNACDTSLRQLCHGNIEALIKNFVDVTLKHNLIESIYMMEEGVPPEHRIAHNRAHMEISLQLKEIRVVFTRDGNCILAIEGVDQALASLLRHFKDFDEQLENYLLASELTP